MKDLPCYEKDFPNWRDMEQKELGEIVVDVSMIIGSSKFVCENYNEDYSPKEGYRNLRYENAFEMVKKNMKEQEEPLYLGFVHFFQFRKNGKILNYVCADGNRRVSACKMLGVKKIMAEATFCFNKKV